MLGEIRRLGGDRLEPIELRGLPSEGLSGVPPEVTAFLTEVGLPVKTAPPLLFYRDARLLRPLIVDGTEYLAVAEEAEAVLALAAGTGEVWSVHPAGLLPKRFVNSGLPAFVLFDLLFEKRLPDLRDADDEDAAGALVEPIRREFDIWDPRALAGSEHWWSLVLDQAEEGFV